MGFLEIGAVLQKLPAGAVCCGLATSDYFIMLVSALPCRAGKLQQKN